MAFFTKKVNIMAEIADKSPEKEMSLFDKALEQGFLYYVNGSFEELCDIFRDPRYIEIDYMPVRYTTLTKDEYIKYKDIGFGWPAALESNNPGLVIFQDKDNVARLGAWNTEK